VGAVELYDGLRVLYETNDAEQLPLLRADITDIKKPLDEGNQVTAAVEYGSVKLSIAEIKISPDGRKYAYIPLDDQALQNLGGMRGVMGSPVQLSATYRAKNPTTLLPITCIHEDGDQRYIFIVNQTWNMWGEEWTAQRMNVTVLETSAKQASIAEQLGYQQVIDGADRPIKDGQKVIRYID